MAKRGLAWLILTGPGGYDPNKSTWHKAVGLLYLVTSVGLNFSSSGYTEGMGWDNRA